MGMAMTILSLSMLGTLRGAAAVASRRICSRQGLGRRWKTAVSDAWDRTVKFYDNLKFVYQIQTMLREWQQQDEEQRPDNGQKTSDQKTDDRKLPVKSAPQGRRHRNAE